jgi:hypothetical protein
MRGVTVFEIIRRQSTGANVASYKIDLDDDSDVLSISNNLEQKYVSP